MPLGKIYNLTPAKFKSFSSPVCSHNMNNTDTKRQMPKKTEATSNVDAVPFSHTRARILQYDINPASFIKDFPLKRWMPYYYSMRISRLMQTMLFRNFFNFLFSKSYHPLPVLPQPLLLYHSFFFFQVLSSSGFSAALFIYFLSSFLFPVLLFPSLCPIYFSSLQIIRTRTFVRKKDLFLPRLRLKYSSALSLFLSFLSSLFRSYSQFYFLSLSDK